MPICPASPRRWRTMARAPCRRPGCPDAPAIFLHAADPVSSPRPAPSPAPWRAVSHRRSFNRAGRMFFSPLGPGSFGNFRGFRPPFPRRRPSGKSAPGKEPSWPTTARPATPPRRRCRPQCPDAQPRGPPALDLRDGPRAAVDDGASRRSRWARRRRRRPAAGAGCGGTGEGGAGLAGHEHVRRSGEADGDADPAVDRGARHLAAGARAAARRAEAARRRSRLAEKARPSDRRFAAPEWRDNPLFDTIRQTYLLVSDRLLGSVDAIEGVDAPTREKIALHDPRLRRRDEPRPISRSPIRRCSRRRWRPRARACSTASSTC